MSSSLVEGKFGIDCFGDGRCGKGFAGARPWTLFYESSSVAAGEYVVLKGRLVVRETACRQS